MSPLVRVCTCGALTPTTPCPNCRSAQNQARNQRPKATGIWQTPRWRRVRAVALRAADYICEDCGAEATTVHHADGYDDPFDPRGLTVLCASCHGRRHGGRHE